MKRFTRTRLATLLLFAWMLTAFGVSGQTPEGLEPQLPQSSFKNLNVQAGGPEEIDLSTAVGERPLVLLYWVAGHPRADATFKELEALTSSLGEAVGLLGVAVPRPGRGEDVITTRLKEIGVKAPVLNDEGFKLGNALGVQAVPNISIIDKDGVLRLTNGGSLQQVIGYKLTVEDAVRRVTSTGKLGTYGYLPRYYPVKELVGQKAPDFAAPRLADSVEARWSSMVAADKINLLIFWSVDCPHCRKSLPKINGWLKSHPEQVNVVSAALVTNDTIKTKTREYCDYVEFVFPTLIDRDSAISELYHVTSTPTIVVVGPDGVVDSVLLTDPPDFGKKIEEIAQRVLK